MFTRIKSGLASKTLAIAVSIVIHTGTPADAADVASELAGETGAISRTVGTAGLNLTLPSDQAILRQRIADVSRQICQELVVDEDILGADLKNCIQSAEASGWAAAEVKIAAAQHRSVVASVRP